MIYPEIKKLYKYQSYNVNSISGLIHKTIWAAKPTTFNDPFDCAVSLYPELDGVTLIKLLIDSVDQLIDDDNEKEKTITALQSALDDPDSLDTTDERFTDMVNTLRNINEEAIKHIGVVSLSAIEDNMLMWSHYAQQHQGFCIEFNRDKNNSLGSKKTLPVRYTHKLPQFRLEDLIGSTGKERRDILHSMVLSKALDWSYEQEWRYLSEYGDVPISLNSKITAIIFGARMSQAHKDTIIEVVSKYHSDVAFKEVKLKEEGFGLEVVPYNIVEKTSTVVPRVNAKDKLALIKFGS
ncbi:TPA: DUF2971 domain-containing protein [Vibrio cholerae]|uniref:DUF2971 domain-containing protein n=1 Tax=Vibrio cholerae TaxID=666 RepID=UPI001D696807|nr:DUF2971 domain-containing protein [Vibrio cholerae]EHH1192042.1 DUF2971 domain-containing protein [Vibrio vulnificus]EHU4850653.1 DUF2971 domain-containing protein [Vibrio vulnificus]EIA1304877.1 DUF2971 domain-containing protein [Vibrio vulnificus]EIV8483557.1 DUF2971 domain-containing protein [Vibrio vulnificus]